ncbi:MAG TPA: acyl--CoA ligase family protein [Gaiellales bacterium]|nr:acyl--CoA ligase family protein [Gaiellales bacterium]
MSSGDAVHLSHLTPVAFLDRTAACFPERIGVVDGDRRLTWATLRDRCRRMAVAIQRLGIGHGERVAVLAPNSAEHLEAHFGVPWSGASLVAVNTRLMPDEIAYILNHSGSRVLIVDPSLAELIEPIADRTGVERMITVGDEYEQLLADAGDGEPDRRLVDDDDVISINYTSGTTGRPKGVMYTHRGAYLNALAELVHARLDSSSSYLWTLPMFHCNGWCFPWAVTAAAATHVCLRGVDPGLIWRLLDDEGVTHFNGAPTVLVMVAGDPAAHVLERPVRITTAAAPPSPSIIARMEALGFSVNHVYGLTETYGPITICEWHPEWDELEPDQRARLRARQGVGMITSDRVRVVDDEMRDVPADANTMGEVVMRGNNVMKGYFDDPEATATAFRGGWFHSGDLGVMHPDGYIELRDRAKDIIISGGENISTIEVEQVLLRHPDVLEVAIVAMPDERWGERPMAFVTLRAGTHLSERDLIAFARGSLPGFKAPDAVEFCELPKTSTGKIKKYELRERARRTARVAIRTPEP